MVVVGATAAAEMDCTDVEEAEAAAPETGEADEATALQFAGYIFSPIPQYYRTQEAPGARDILC